jgi:serine phosphatase RsbU (regulator of sigma subunit)
MPAGGEYFWNVKVFHALSRRRGAIFVVVGRDVTHLLLERSAKVRLEGELETAKLIQTAFLPAESKVVEGLAIASFFEPADRCSGDWWGHFSIGPGLELVCVADAMGHGASAAIVTAMVHSCSMMMASLLESQGQSRFDSPSALLSELNRIIFQTLKGRVSMTFFAALFDTVRGTFVYSNAGQTFPFFLPLAADDERFGRSRVSRHSGKPNVLAQPSDPLGVRADTRFIDERFPLKLGDTLVLYTDGLIESTNSEGKAWGRRALARTIIESKFQTVFQLADAITGRSSKFFAGEPLNDDITLVLAQFTGLKTTKTP